MDQHNNGSTTLPRGFRYHHIEDRPTTPEQTTSNEPEPQVPRLPRFKVKRRHVSSITGPTSQFLASVAAADTPIPTIEIPQDFVMTDREFMPMADGYLSPQPHGFRSGSPPKTPVPTFAEIDQGSRFPDWSRDTPEPRSDYFGRPKSSYSNASDCSDDSFYSGSRLSRPSNDDSTCTSPEADLPDPFQYSSVSKGNGDFRREPVITLNGGSTNLIRDTGVLNRSMKSKSQKDAVWTKSQSNHLWATYLMYLQDPTQTPFRFGVSCIPPEGVVHRVSRQAKRSWKGPKVITPLDNLRNALEAPSRVKKSGSNTPTQDFSRSYGAWPHSKTATRTHLKELCRSKSTTAVHHSRHLQARSSEPFDNFARHRSPESRGTFNTQDISVSLVTSTSETMQPNGPLAKLATETSPITPVGSGPEIAPFKRLPNTFGYDEVPRRLGSPFVSQTYGPSSTLTAPETRPQPLRSPISFGQTRSLHNTQKRRAVHDLDAELSPNGAVLRPGILNEQLFGAPLNSRRVRNRGFSLGDEAFRQRAPDILYNPVSDIGPAMDSTFSTVPSLMPSAPFNNKFTNSLHEKFGPPPRLGSPLDFGSNSNTFPRRQVLDSSAPLRPYATMHQSRRSIESFDFGPSLTNRRTQLAQVKLKEIQEREEALRIQNPPPQ